MILGYCIMIYKPLSSTTTFVLMILRCNMNPFMYVFITKEIIIIIINCARYMGTFLNTVETR